MDRDPGVVHHDVDVSMGSFDFLGERHHAFTVGDVAYLWRATGNDGWISLSIWPKAHHRASIHAQLPYNEHPEDDGKGGLYKSHQIVITARIVRRVIEHARQHAGYDPAGTGPTDLRAVGDVIDLSDALRASR